MDYLHKLYAKLNRGPQLKTHAAAALIVLCAYVAMAYTTLSMYGLLHSALLALGLVFVAVLVLFTIAFVLSKLLNRLDIVDMTWPLSIMLAAFASFGLNAHSLGLGWNIQTLVCLLVTIWALRLALHIGDRLLKTAQDKRYTALQKKWHRAPSLQAFIRIFVVQALLATSISIVLLCINLAKPEIFGPIAFAGLVVWCTGFVFEAVGDWQLANHRRLHPKTLMTTGLWRYTRHPNYFGESVQWWGIFIIALSVPFGWLGVISPLIITYLLLYISGVPLTEIAFEGRTGWKTYKRRTSAFVPRIPKA